MVQKRTESEMSKREQSLVDVCFEEGQYDSAILALDQLRSQGQRPSPEHIRQLLYIALYPPTLKGKERPLFNVNASPSKMHRQQKSHQLVLSEHITLSAQRLLLSFARTNTPEAIFAGLPRYPPDETPISEEADSLVALESMCISDCRDCWSMLPTGFIRPAKTASTPGRKNKKRSTRAHGANIDDDGLVGEPAVIANHAWPVLEWLILTFERDETLALERDQLRYSPLLLSQIPLPRGEKQARWEFDQPLDIILHCLQQEDEMRKRLGYKLLIQLINLTSTVYVDYPLFISSVLNRLVTLTFDELSELFGAFPPTPVAWKCRVFLCHKYLTNRSVQTGSRTSVRPKPQARAPRVARQATTVTAVLTAEGEPQIATGSNPTASSHPLPSTAEVLRLMTLAPSTSASASGEPTYIQICFELLVAYGSYHRVSDLSNEQEKEWRAFLNSGDFTKALDTSFGRSPESEGWSYRDILSACIACWQQQ